MNTIICVSWIKITRILNDRLIILEELKTHLQVVYGNRLDKLVLFGSRATGLYRQESDYDVLIVLNGAYTWKDENTIWDICYDLSLKYSVLIDTHILSSLELGGPRGKQRVFTRALDQGIYV